MQDIEQTIISQYAQAPTLTQLIENLNVYFDPTANIDAFYNLVWNIETAEGYGLDIWGRIVGVGRVLQVSAATYLGFKEATDAETFGFGPFYSGAPVTNNYALSDESYRTLILAKAAANISNSSIPAINAILMMLFPAHGNCYCTDGEDMTMTYTFGSLLSPVELAIVEQSGVLPKPAGVSFTVVQ